MTPDRIEDARAVLKAYRRRWRDRPDRLTMLDHAASGTLILQELWLTNQTDIDIPALTCGRAPGLILVDDMAGAGPAGWAAARDCRAWARVAVIAAGEIEAEMLIEAAREFGRVLAIETARAAMPAWSSYLVQRMRVGLIDGNHRGFISGTIH